MKPSLALVLSMAAAPLWAQDAPAVDELAVLQARVDLREGRMDEALAVIAPAAEAGDPRAQVLYGEAFERGLAGAPDAQAALSWYMKAADQGYPGAMYALGNIHRYGAEGFEPDPALAETWLRRGTAMDHIPSFALLGAMLLYGDAGPADPDAGLVYLQRAAGRGDPDAAYDLGLAYHAGEGVERDDVLSRRYYLAAASVGDAWAQNNLGYFMAEGIGGPKDLAQAEAVLREAMAQGHDQAGQTMAMIIVDNPEVGDGLLSAPAHCVWALELAAEKAMEAESRDWCTALLGDLDPGTVELAREAAFALAPTP